MGCYAIGGSLWNLVSWNWKGWYPIGESVFLRSIFFRKQKVGPRKILIQVIVLMIFLQDQFPCYIADVPNDQVPYRSQFKHSTQTIFQGAQILNNRFVWMVLYCVTYGKKNKLLKMFLWHYPSQQAETPLKPPGWRKAHQPSAAAPTSLELQENWGKRSLQLRGSAEKRWIRDDQSIDI